MKMTIKSVLAATILGLASTSSAFAAGEAHHEKHDFSFDGAFGVYDQGELQRGFHVFKEICSSCHGMKYVPFRTLTDTNGPGFSEDEAKAIAAGFDVPDDGDEAEPGDTRPAALADYFPTPEMEGHPPDMSLLAKAREGGPLHIYSILLGYADEPECAADADMNGSYNTAFGIGAVPDSCKDENGHSTITGSWIGMGQPIYEDDIEYTDGTPQTLEQYSNDVSAFLMWAAEPKMVERKQAGVWSIGFLILFAALVFFTNRKIWAKIKHPEDDA